MVFGQSNGSGVELLEEGITPDKDGASCEARKGRAPVLIVINVLLVILGSAAGLVALLGETWDSGRRRLTRLGYWTGACMALTLTLGVAKECLNHQQEVKQEAAIECEREQMREAFKLLAIGQANVLEKTVLETPPWNREFKLLGHVADHEGRCRTCGQQLLEFAERIGDAKGQTALVK
jgi:hypothetical protein